MSDLLCIELPAGLADADLLSPLAAGLDRLRPALDLEADRHDPLAQVEALRLVGVEVAGERVVVSYELDIEAFHACRDLRHRRTERRRVAGLRRDDTLIFERFEPLPERSSGDEL